LIDCERTDIVILETAFHAGRKIVDLVLTCYDVFALALPVQQE